MSSLDYDCYVFSTSGLIRPKSTSRQRPSQRSLCSPPHCIPVINVSHHPSYSPTFHVSITPLHVPVESALMKLCLDYHCTYPASILLYSALAYLVLSSHCKDATRTDADRDRTRCSHVKPEAGAYPVRIRCEDEDIRENGNFRPVEPSRPCALPPTTFLSLSSLLVYRLNCYSPMYVQISVHRQYHFLLLDFYGLVSYVVLPCQ